MKRFEELKDIVLNAEGDFAKFYEKGNNAAGTRVRKTMQNLKNIAQDIRKEVQAKKNAQYSFLGYKKKGFKMNPFFYAFI